MIVHFRVLLNDLYDLFDWFSRLPFFANRETIVQLAYGLLTTRHWQDNYRSPVIANQYTREAHKVEFVCILRVSSRPWFHFCDWLSNPRKKPVDSQIHSNHSVVAVYKRDAPRVAWLSSLNQSSFPTIDAQDISGVRAVAQHTKTSSHLMRPCSLIRNN
jgi:hypothetical protein